eukprot:60499-Amphidinium_carterae.1
MHEEVGYVTSDNMGEEHLATLGAQSAGTTHGLDTTKVLQEGASASADQDATGTIAMPSVPVGVDAGSHAGSTALVGRSSAAAPETKGPNVPYTCRVDTDFGHISFYDKGSFFEAVCNNCLHGSCKLRRTALVKKGGLGGRPLGFMMKWLSENHVNREVHWDKSTWQSWDQESRILQRLSLASLDSGATLLGYERPLTEGEPEEPLTLKGYL